MKKLNLKIGDIVKLRNGDCFICIGENFCSGDFYINLDEYNENKLKDQNQKKLKNLKKKLKVFVNIGKDDDFCCAKGFDKFKLAYEIANLEWR